MKTTVYQGKFFNVVHEPTRLANGETCIFEWVERTDGVRVIARDTGDNILLTNEYRHEINGRDMRLPGGKVEDGLSALETAKRELREETGYVAKGWRALAVSQAFATVHYRLHYFEAFDLHLDPIDHDEGEDIEVVWTSADEVFRMAISGDIGEDLSALQLIRLLKKEE